MELKYIMTSQDEFVIFSPTFVHRDIAHGLNDKIVSAGNITIQQEGNSRTRVNAHCYGHSHTLNLVSRPEEDSEIINHRLNYRGY